LAGVSAALGADLKAANENGTTPVLVAAQADRESTVRCLVSPGAGVNAPHNDGVTPLMIALQKGHASVETALLNAGVSPRLRWKTGGLR
jgi:ankyrin repeat protein